ncbi:uncharacterized protein V1516DRAFT_680016 [Lipomyces oligophaga]|uniref:uncharacterized protein n=1 Tax=Lipomyces oligophaga TaxID=45792 RepID=UPI0034CEB332
MVEISTVKTSNSLLKKSMPSEMVAVFVGATSGIGKSTLIHFAKYTSQPRIYFVGRSQVTADSILNELREINRDGEYNFVFGDMSLLSAVDKVCAEIKTKEKYINVLFQSQGTLDLSTVTAEKLTAMQALSYYSRMRFIVNLLPLLQCAPSLRRVITVLAGTKEGPINPADIAGKKVAPWKARGHLVSMMTLTLEKIASQAPTVSFIHDYPGAVKTPLSRTLKGPMGTLIKVGFAVIFLFITMEEVPIDESGERHVFLATSSMFPPKEKLPDSSPSGLPVVEDLEICIGSDGKPGSGVYTVGAYSKPGDAAVLKVLAQLREEGIGDMVWDHLQEEFLRITGRKSVI